MDKNLNDEWIEVKGESNIWLPTKEGDSIEGIIISMIQSTYGLSVIIEDKDHKQILMPSHKVLQSRLSYCKVGDIVKVIYEKEELPKIRGQNPTRIYKVLTKKI
jgi:hypothetical protein